tara:strand:- start:8451 stop:10187 length:1737 start_codon:yes stop_codon:yes gene_type:complete
MKDTQPRLVKAAQKGELLEIAYEMYRAEWDERKTVSDALAEIHNKGLVDVIKEYRKLTRDDSKRDFFMLRHALEDALPTINAPVREVMACVKHLTLEAGNDMAAGALISPFIGYCKVDKTRPDEVLDYAIEEIDQEIDFVTPAILAGSSHDLKAFVSKAISLCGKDCLITKRRAVHALGRVTYEGNETLVFQAYKAVVLLSEELTDGAIYAEILKTLFALSQENSEVEEKALAIVDSISKLVDERLTHSASDILFFESDKITDEMLERLLAILVHTLPKNGGTIDHIDYGLQKMVQNGKIDRAVLFLEALFEQCDYQIDVTVFDSFVRELFQNKESYLQPLLTKWLLAKKVKLGRFCFELLNSVTDKGIPLAIDSPQLKGLESGAFLFLARKACGWFFMRPVSAVSLMLSCIELASEDEVDQITEVIFDPLFISYPGSIRDYFDSIYDDSGSIVQSTIEELRTRLEAYHKGLKATQEIKELLPPEVDRETYTRYQNRLMNDSYKEARKSSIFSMIATESVLLYGRSSIHYVSHGNKKTRQETPLQMFSHSVEYPSLECLDPHGLDSVIRRLRIEGCRS